MSSSLDNYKSNEKKIKTTENKILRLYGICIGYYINISDILIYLKF